MIVINSVSQKLFNLLPALKNVRSNTAVIPQGQKIYPNLQPLSKDTVSFSGQASGKVINNKEYYGGNGPLVRKIYGAAQIQGDNFEKVLKETFASCCEFEGNKPKRPVAHMVFSRKSISSIKEKFASNRIVNEAEAKDTIRDIVRARIVIDDTEDNKGGNIICSKLIKAVKEKKLNIVNIKNYYEMDPKYNHGVDTQYISFSNLLNLDNEVSENYGISVLKSGQTKDSGYNAVHIIFKLDDGFYGELQIMGKEVEKMKEIEDIIYKIECNKHIPPKFDEVKKVYSETIAKSPKKEAALSEYTRLAYNAQRFKELGIYSGKETTEFLPLPKNSNLPQIFDYNNLARIYRS